MKWFRQKGWKKNLNKKKNFAKFISRWIIAKAEIPENLKEKMVDLCLWITKRRKIIFKFLKSTTIYRKFHAENRRENIAKFHHENVKFFSLALFFSHPYRKYWFFALFFFLLFFSTARNSPRNQIMKWDKKLLHCFRWRILNFHCVDFCLKLKRKCLVDQKSISIFFAGFSFSQSLSLTLSLARADENVKISHPVKLISEGKNAYEGEKFIVGIDKIRWGRPGKNNKEKEINFSFRFWNIC